MVHAVFLCLLHLSSCLFSLSLPSLSAADFLVTLFCVFSPAACAGYPVWSNIPGGDRSKLPGKFVIFILNVFFPPVILLLSSSSWLLLLWFIRTQEHYVCANVPTPLWHPHEILQRVWITDCWVFKQNLPLKKAICAVKSHLFSRNMVEAN